MLTIFTDGSALIHAGYGGWAYVREDGKCRAGAVRGRGSNVMELWAVLEALASIAKSTDVLICTDSDYVLKARRGRLFDELRLWVAFHRGVEFRRVRDHRLHLKAHHMAREAMFKRVNP